MSTVAVADLHVERDGRAVLHRIDLTATRGEWLGIIGPNGSGKTTFLHALAGLLPSTGAVRIAGADPRRLGRRALARLIAIVPQRPTAPAGLQVQDYVLLGRMPHLGPLGRESPADRDAVAAVLDRLDLSGIAGRSVDHLSGGEFQRVVLARCLAQHAPLLLLDEPTTALDVGREQSVLELVDELRRSEGLTVLSAMHDLTAAAQFSDRLVLFADGRLVAEGTPREVLTPERLALHYAADVSVVEDGEGGIAVVPRRVRHPAASGSGAAAQAAPQPIAGRADGPGW